MWDSPGTTKNIRRTEKQDNWIFYGAKNSRCSMTGITVWSKKRRVRGIARATATCRYAVHPLRSTNRPSAVVLLYNMKLLPGSRPVPPAANREKGAAVVEPACRKNCKSIAVYIAALLFFSAGGVCGLEIRQHFEESEYGNRGDFPDYPDSGTKKVRETADGRSAPDTESILQTAGCAFDGYAAVCALYGESRDICTAEPGLFRRTGTDRDDISFRTFCDRI